MTRFEVLYLLSASSGPLKCTWSAKCFMFVDFCQSHLLVMFTVCIAWSVWSVCRDKDWLPWTIANLMLSELATAQWHLSLSVLSVSIHMVSHIKYTNSAANLFWFVDPCYICGYTMFIAIIYSHSPMCTLSHLMHFEKEV